MVSGGFYDVFKLDSDHCGRYLQMICARLLSLQAGSARLPRGWPGVAVNPKDWHYHPEHTTVSVRACASLRERESVPKTQRQRRLQVCESDAGRTHQIISQHHLTFTTAPDLHCHLHHHPFRQHHSGSPSYHPRGLT